MASKQINFRAGATDRKILDDLMSEFEIGHSAILSAALKEYHDRHKKDEYAKLYQKCPRKTEAFFPIENRSQIVDGEGYINRENVKEWLKDNLFGMGKDCARELSISKATANRHLRELRKEIYIK